MAATPAISSKNNSVFVQPKLIINRPDDDYEQEAEAVAEKVVLSKPITNSNDLFKPSLWNNSILSHTVIQRISANESPYEEDGVYVEDDNTAQSKLVSGIIQRMQMRNTSWGPDHIMGNIAPWGGTRPNGDKHYAYTDSGTYVKAWTAIDYNSEASRYWCHGYTLRTYRNWFYSIYSGPPMQNVVSDEYNAVPDPSVQNTDIAVWVPNYDHSCIVNNISRNSFGIYDNSTMMSTKNGVNPLATMSLASVKNIYSNSNNAPKFFRHV